MGLATACAIRFSDGNPFLRKDEWPLPCWGFSMRIRLGRNEGREMKGRVVRDHVALNYGDIKKFFDERGENDALKSKYNYVLFQDQEPELAIRRDAQEKEKIGALLSLSRPLRVLDIGCGIGRWGEYLLERGAYYVGIDGSEKMIERAEENLKQYDSKRLTPGFFQDLLSLLAELGEQEPFDLILVNGVFMYLNDEDFEKALQDMQRVAGQNCELYIKESMGIKERLTLYKFFSEGLNQHYSAIYRSIEEYRKSFERAFAAACVLVEEGILFDDDLRNHTETTDYYFVWKRR